MINKDVADKLKYLEDAISKAQSKKFDEVYLKSQIDDMINKRDTQYDVRTQTWTQQNKPRVKDILSATSYEQARQDEINKRRLYIKAAIAMLRTHKGLDLELEDVETMSYAWEDPLSSPTTMVAKIIDREQIRYGNFRNMYRFMLMMTFEDFEERYGPKDYENNIPRVPVQTVVTMRLATKIYWAWKEHIYNKK